LTGGARRQPYEEMQSCVVRLLPDAYRRHYTLTEDGLVLPEETEDVVSTKLLKDCRAIADKMLN